MRKFLISNLILCALLCAPVLALRGQDPVDLRERLVAVVNSLATFGDVQKRVEARDLSVVPELLAMSEAGPIDPEAAESEMVALRTRVNALQEILDARAVWVGEISQAPGLVKESALHGMSTGASATKVPAVTATHTEDGSKVAFEGQDFIADRTRLGRACWRGGRYLEGVAALEPLAGDPKADYWRARCLEKLGRATESLELYGKVIQIAGDSPEGRSARDDREFLEWSMGHGLVNKP